MDVCKPKMNAKLIDKAFNSIQTMRLYAFMESFITPVFELARIYGVRLDYN